MIKAKVSDILIVGLISGVVAIATSLMGIAGTIIGAVVTSIGVQLMTTLFRDPLKDKIEEKEEHYFKKTRHQSQSYNPQPTQNNTYDDSIINSKTLFLFPLIIILIIELIHFLGFVHIIPTDIFYNLEQITNWTLFKTIGYALVIMGIYPFISKKLGTEHGVILIIVGFILLIIGYADTNVSIGLLYQTFFASLREYINIAVILAMLYTVLTIPNNSEKDNEKQYVNNKVENHIQQQRKFNKSYRNTRQNNYKKSSDEYSEDKFYDNSKDKPMRQRSQYNNKQNNRNYKKQENDDAEFNEDDYYYYY